MKAKLSFIVKPWSGWNEKQPPQKKMDLDVEQGQTISQTDLASDAFSFSFALHSITDDQITLHCRGLSVSKDGHINMMAAKRNPNFPSYDLKGESAVVIKTGQTVIFSSPTVDMGVNVSVTVNSIG
jgi:hypothetical protein